MVIRVHHVPCVPSYLGSSIGSAEPFRQGSKEVGEVGEVGSGRRSGAEKEIRFRVQLELLGKVFAEWSLRGMECHRLSDRFRRAWMCSCRIFARRTSSKSLIPLASLIVRTYVARLRTFDAVVTGWPDDSLLVCHIRHVMMSWAIWTCK